MKALFLVFHGFMAYNGISKKIHYQVNALKQCGIDTTLCYLDIDENGIHKRMLDEKTLESFGKGIKAKIAKRIQYNTLVNYIIQNKIELLYVRYDHNANPFLIKAMTKLKKNGVKIILEIPTYPYDQEYKNTPICFQLMLLFDKIFRKILAKQIYRIVTFSGYKNIFNIPTINISNGIDFDHVKVKTRTNNNQQSLNLIGVAEIHSWHGFDRILKGMAEYYKKRQETEVNFTIVGEGDAKIIENLKAIVLNNNIHKYVHFTGPKFGDELDKLFEEADMGIASLARHRSNIIQIKTLKNREYAARGIPFIYSEIDEDFDNMPYVMKVKANEEPIVIKDIVNFYHKQSFYPYEIRKSIINTLSWKTQMKRIVDECFPKNKPISQ